MDTNPSNTGNILVRVALALQRAEGLGACAVATEQPIETLRQATTAAAAAAADLLDELLEQLVTDRQRFRSLDVDRLHAAASPAAGDLREVLRTIRTLHPDQGSDYRVGCLRARDRVASIGLSARVELARELGVR